MSDNLDLNIDTTEADAEFLNQLNQRIANETGIAGLTLQSFSKTYGAPNRELEFNATNLKLFKVLQPLNVHFPDRPTLFAEIVTLGISGTTTLSPMKVAQTALTYVMYNAGILAKDVNPPEFQAKISSLYAEFSDFFGELPIEAIKYKTDLDQYMTWQEIAPRNSSQDAAQTYGHIEEFFKRDGFTVRKNALLLCYGLLRNIARRSNKKNVSYSACTKDYGFMHYPGTEFTDRVNSEAADLAPSIAVLTACAEDAIVSSGAFVGVGAEIEVHLIVRLAWGKMAVVANAVKVAKSKKIHIHRLADLL